MQDRTLCPHSTRLLPLAAMLALGACLTTPVSAIENGHALVFDGGAFGHDGGTYTWEELAELIPDLREGKVERRAVETAEGAAAVPMICERKPEIGTRLATRQCYTLEQYVRKECSLGVRTLRVPDWCQAFLPGPK